MSSDYFVHLTDTHLTSTCDEGWLALERFVQQINVMNPLPAFVVNTGDIVFANMQIQSKAEEYYSVFERYQQIMSALPVPLYNVLGNHDMTQCDLAPGEPAYGKVLFERFCGPRYQSFEWGDIHVVILDQWLITRNNAGDGLLRKKEIDDTQLGWLKQDLTTCHPGQTVIFFLHHPVVDYPNLFRKLHGVLRNDLHYLEMAGCDHQNSFSQIGNWRTMTTASFCGAWWKGPCIDGAPAGYALMFRDSTETIKPYYRGMTEPLAVASPLPGQTVAETISVQAYESRTGQAVEYEVNIHSWKPGWRTLEIETGELRQTTQVFCKPTHTQSWTRNIEVNVEFELLECNGQLALEANGETLAQFSSGNIGINKVSLPPDKLCDWNLFHFAGDSVIRAPRLVLDGILVQDPRMEYWESLRPDWFGERKRIKWDTTLRCLKTPWLYPEHTFFFPVRDDSLR